MIIRGGGEALCTRRALGSCRGPRSRVPRNSLAIQSHACPHFDPTVRVAEQTWQQARQLRPRARHAPCRSLTPCLSRLPSWTCEPTLLRRRPARRAAARQPGSPAQGPGVIDSAIFDPHAGAAPATPWPSADSGARWSARTWCGLRSCAESSTAHPLCSQAPVRAPPCAALWWVPLLGPRAAGPGLCWA